MVDGGEPGVDSRDEGKHTVYNEVTSPPERSVELLALQQHDIRPFEE